MKPQPIRLFPPAPEDSSGEGGEQAPAAVEPHIRARDAEGVIDAVPKLFKALLLDVSIDVAGSVGPNSSLLTVTLVDRLIHRSEIIEIEGESYRLKEAKELKDAKAKSRKENPAATEFMPLPA